MKKLLLLPGDGIGQEVIAECEKILAYFIKESLIDAECKYGVIGAQGIINSGEPLPKSTRQLAKNVDAILLGAVGEPKFNDLPYHQRPENGLLQLRSDFDFFANIRPAFSLPTHLKNKNFDIVIIRELVGGIYYSKPRGIYQKNNIRTAYNTMKYSEDEIARIAKVAFEFALSSNRKKICSVDKANVLEVSQLWREVVTEISKQYSSVTLEHCYVDNAAMRMTSNPESFDIILTGNLFGDILSDCAVSISGSIGTLPSMTFNPEGIALYEPVHGSAPDIAGKNLANPIAAILSLSLMLEHTFKREDLASLVKQAIFSLLEQKIYPKDLAKKNEKYYTTTEFGEKLLTKIIQQSKVAT